LVVLFKLEFHWLDSMKLIVTLELESTDGTKSYNGKM
jgi:hypothetical protein